jgi:hypothetical protein
VSDKTGWEGRDQSRGTQVGAHGALSRALGAAKGNNYALEPLDGYIVQGCSGAKTEIPANSSCQGECAMKTMLLLSAAFALVANATMMGQPSTYHLVTTRPGTANDTETLNYWCSQVGPQGTPLAFFQRTLAGPVPVTINWFTTGGEILIQDLVPSLYHWPGDFLQGDCLVRATNFTANFSRPVSQFGLQVNCAQSPVSITAKDCHGHEFSFSTSDICVGRQDGSASYVGVENTAGATICEVDYGNTGNAPYAINEPSITVPNDPYCYTPPNTTMVAWYPFDEPSPVLTSANLATGNNGAQYNGPLGFSSGNVAGAASFNGTNQYVESPSTNATNFGFAILPAACAGPGYSGSGDYSACRADFSIDTWVEVNVFSGVMTILDKRDGTPPNIYGYSFFLYNGAMGLQLADGVGAQGYTNYSSPPLPSLTNGMWHHIAVTINRTATNGITWYYDGVAIGNSTADRLGSLVNSSPLRIGTRTASPPLSGWFRGSLDELEIYNRELTGAEVNGIYSAVSHGKCK